MPNRPTGTVTFLFTDIEGFTRPKEDNPTTLQADLARQEAILRGAIDANGGYAYKRVGNAFQVAFHTAPQAVRAALQAQRNLHPEQGGPESDVGVPMALGMALHTGVTEERGDDYVGPLLNRVARLLAAGHGGQVLLTLATAELVRDNLPEGASLKDLGEHRLKDLFRPERVYQLEAPGLPADFPPLKTLEARPNNLPLQPTPFMGRDREVAEVCDTLCREDVSLLTLTGPGGIGKTRLALQAAADLLDEFPDGVFFVPLATISDPVLVISSITHSLDVREVGGQPLLAVLGDYLRDKSLLLVLDNFEQLLGLKPNSFDAATVLADLIGAAPHLKVLVTSRAPLHLSVEHQYPVPALSLPPTGAGHLPTVEALSQFEAVALFISRAQAANPRFEVDNRNAPAVAEICVRLDGLPLAIELAAARIKLLSPQEMLTRLQSRLNLLKGGGRDLPARQQTLRGAIEWSHDLLEDVEKHLFRRLAVFVSGCTLEAAEAVCNAEGDLEIDVLDGVASLVDKSLLVQQEGVEGEPRFGMLETIREFARERLQESGELQVLEKQHARYFISFAEQAEPELIGPNQAKYLDRLEADHDNIRAVLNWAEEQSNINPEAAETGLRLAGAIWRFWYVRGHYREGRERLEEIVGWAEETPEGGTGLRTFKAKALHGAGALTHAQGDIGAARLLYERSLALRRELGEERGIASLLNNLGVLAYHEGDYASARSLYEECLAIARRAGDKWSTASSLNNLANAAYQQGDYAAARSLHEESLALKREQGDKNGESNSLANIGLVAEEQGDYETARSRYEESLALRRQLGDKGGIAASLLSLGDLAYKGGDYAAARAMREESLALFRELGDKEGGAYATHNLGLAAQEEGDFTVARSLMEEGLALRREMGDKIAIVFSLAGLGGLAVSTGQVEQGTRMLGAVEGLLESMGAVLGGDIRLPYERALERARSQVGEEQYERLRAEGQAMSMEQTIDCALGSG